MAVVPLGTLSPLPSADADVLQRELGAAQNQNGTRFNNVWYQFFNLQRQRLISILSTSPINVRNDAGAKMDGSDDSVPFQNAINAAIKQGGGIVFVPSGKLSFRSVNIPASAPPILVSGQSHGTTILQQLGAPPQGKGMIDVLGKNFSLSDMTIQTNSTSARRMRYNVDFNTGLGNNDPMAPSLTNGTSVWVHGGAAGFSCVRTRFTHSAGYSILLDATTQFIDDPDIEACIFEDIRAALFGTNPNDINYGSWLGGIFMSGDGRTSGSSVVRRPSIVNCRFRRVSGNCVWSHLYALNALHESLIVQSCHFEDSGLDSILVGGFTGGSVSDNVIRRNGYVSLVDGQIGTPRWLAGFAPTAIDSAGIVKGVNYVNNSITSPNGGSFDLDGHSLSAFSGNLSRVPFNDEPEFAQDSIPSTGPLNKGSQSYGLNTGNTNSTPEGATSINVVGNTFVNLAGGSIRFYSARFCSAKANIINAPSNSVNPPVALGPIGTGPNQRCHDNVIAHNYCSYSPASPSTPFCFEDDTITPFLNTEQNYIFGNQPQIGNGNSVEFQKSPNSGSTVYQAKVWFP